MKKYIIGVDEGTTSCRAGIYNVQTHVLSGLFQKEIPIFTPHDGWVEQDAEVIYQTFLETIKGAIKSAGIDIKEVLALAITNQRETAVAWNKESGKPVARTITWQCRRTSAICKALSKKQQKLIKEKTGLIVDAYFTGSKLQWFLENNSEIKKLAKESRLCFGTMETYLIYRLTEGKCFVSDVSNASRTMLFNIKTLKWDDELLKIFGVPKETLAKQIVSTDEFVGEFLLMGEKIPICGLIGDQQSALVGQTCFDVGEVKNTYGTGCFMVMNTGHNKLDNKNIITTIAYQRKGKEVVYALEGSVLNAGSCIEWLKKIGLIEKSSQTEEMALRVNDIGGLAFVPALTGLGSPYWDMQARGLLIGINRGTTKEQIVRAVLESIAFSSFEVFNDMKKSCGKIKVIKCDGGVSKNNFLMQFQSDVCGTKLLLPMEVESTLMGTIYMSCLGLGIYKSETEIEKLWKAKKEFLPQAQQKILLKSFTNWQRAVKRAMEWAK